MKKQTKDTPPIVLKFWATKYIAYGSLIISCIALLTLQSACKKTPLFATEGATLVISIDKTYLRTGGDQATVTVLGFDTEGEAMHDDTTVVFSVTLGRMAPSEVKIRNGRASSTFISGTQSGTAEIRARSGAITSEPDPLEVVIGSAALETLTISATPASFPAGGGQSAIRVAAFGAGGNLLPQIPVMVSATSGQLLPVKSVYYTDNQGVIDLSLTVTANSTIRAESGDKSAETTIEVEETEENQPPTALFSYSPGSPFRGDRVYFNANQSTDSDGHIVSYKWDFGDGDSADGPEVEHKFKWNGEENRQFQVVLTVTDDKGASASSAQGITVQPETKNILPTADFTWSPQSPNKGETIYFNGGISTDEDGEVVSWEWDFGDGTVKTGKTQEHFYDWNGDNDRTFNVVLTVTDNDGDSHSTEKAVTVSGEDENQTPTAVISVSPTTLYKGDTVYFNGSQSRDSDGSIVSWEWDFGDGTTKSGENVTHIYNWTGDGDRTFVAALTVTDNKGATHTDTESITVKDEPDNIPPVASFSISPTPATAGQNVYFNATQSSDADGTVVNWEWNFGDGTGSFTGETIYHAFSLSGSTAQQFTITLTVTDDKGATHSISKTLTVDP